MYRYSARVSMCILHVYIEVDTCVHMFTYWEPVYIMIYIETFFEQTLLCLNRLS